MTTTSDQSLISIHYLRVIIFLNKENKIHKSKDIDKNRDKLPSTINVVNSGKIFWGMKQAFNGHVQQQINKSRWPNRNNNP